MKERIVNEIVETVAGILLAVAIYKAIGLALGTSSPLIAVVSNSMVPTFYRGDVLIVKSVAPDEIKVGDIIVWSPPLYRYPIVHRVIKVWQENGKYYYTTKGDANRGILYDIGEDKIPYDWVEGKVICYKNRPIVIPKIGYVKIWLVEALFGEVREEPSINS